MFRRPMIARRGATAVWSAIAFASAAILMQVVAPMSLASSPELPHARPIWMAATGSYTSPPVIADGVMYVATARGPLFAFDERCAAGGRSCDPLWTGDTGPSAVVRYPAPIARALLTYPVWFDEPVVADGMVYVVGAGATSLLAFSTSCGTNGVSCAPAWTTDAIAHVSMPAAADGMVYVTAAGRLFAYRSSCGTGGEICHPTWRASGDPSGFLWESPPVLSRGVVFAKSFGGGLYAFDASSGKLLWHAQAGLVTGGRPSAPESGSLGSPPAVDGDVVYVTWAAAFEGHGSRVYAFRTDCRSDGATCRPAWTADLPDSVLTVFGPAAADGRVYVGTELIPAAGEGHLYGFDAGCTDPCRPFLRWKVPGELVVTGPPTISRGSVAIASAEQGLVGLRPAGCDEAGCGATWVSASVLDPLRGTIAGSHVFFGSAAGTLFAFDASCAAGGAPCDPSWVFTSDADVVSSPVADDGLVFSSTSDGHLYALPQTLAAAPAPSVHRVAGTGREAASWIAALILLVALVGAGIALARRRNAHNASTDVRDETELG